MGSNVRIQVETTVPVMNWYYSVKTDRLIPAQDSHSHQELVRIHMDLHFLHSPEILRLQHEMVTTQRGYPVPFRLIRAGYGMDNISFSSTPYLGSIEAQFVLSKIESALVTLASGFRPPKRKTVWDRLRENWLNFT